MKLISLTKTKQLKEIEYIVYEYESEVEALEHFKEMASKGYSVEKAIGTLGIQYSNRVHDEKEIDNKLLITLLELRLAEKGHTHPNDREDLFLHEVFEILNEQKTGR